MKSAFSQGVLKKKYLEPEIEVLIINISQDVICNSQETNEEKDNNFGAGDLGGFLD